MINILVGFKNEIIDLEKTLINLDKNNFLVDNFYKVFIISKGVFKLKSQFIKKYKIKKNRLIIPKSSGIYPSLNYCSSIINENEYIWFLGAGDLTSINAFSLKNKIINAEKSNSYNPKKIIGHSFNVNIYSHDKKFIYRHFQRFKIPYSLILNTLHHQGLIIKNSYLKKFKYPEDTKTYSDFSISLNSYNNNFKFFFHKESISNFYLGGESSKSRLLYFQESTKLRLKYLNFFIAIILSLLHLLSSIFLFIKGFLKKK